MAAAGESMEAQLAAMRAQLERSKAARIYDDRVLYE